MISVNKWIIPKGDRQANPWNQKDVSQYIKDVLDQFIKQLSPIVTVFVRNGIAEDLRREYENDFREGRLAWFHTSSEAESRAMKGNIWFLWIIAELVGHMLMQSLGQVLGVNMRSKRSQILFS